MPSSLAYIMKDTTKMIKNTGVVMILPSVCSLDIVPQNIRGGYYLAHVISRDNHAVYWGALSLRTKTEQICSHDELLEERRPQVST